MTKQASLCEMLNIDFPVIMAPMFLVSNEEMTIQAIRNGITGAIPALNYRTVEDLRSAIRRIKQEVDGPFGINLIVNKSNFLYKEQLRVCCEEKISYFITSLGSPAETIAMAKKHGVKVFCDVVDVSYARKVEALGADAIIAVNKEAGGHAGPTPFSDLIPELKKACSIPIISAGGIGDGQGIKEMIDLGADGVSMGSIFIATKEAPVSQDYKEACVNYGAKDIVFTTKLSGTPCTVINTPYVDKIGTSQNFLERFLNKNKKLKKWFKAITFMRGMKSLQNAAFSTTYKTVWCAGPSIEYVKEILSVKEVIDGLKKGFNA
ncbi:MAG: nitronate monooxygenase [Crocinitomicaceae bacterium]|mgnify:FL=1|jgi:nitronate monooxygenase|tara:strand:+ start:788 stop:1747 length:960 start_codon:yes stop_codon:yes gene_type:complete